MLARSDLEFDYLYELATVSSLVFAAMGNINRNCGKKADKVVMNIKRREIIRLDAPSYDRSSFLDRTSQLLAHHLTGVWPYGRVDCLECACKTEWL